MTSIPQFGLARPGANYLLRPGGYAIILRGGDEVATVSTPLGLALPGGGQDDGESLEDAAIRETAEECGLRIAISREIGIADELVFASDEQRHYRKRCTFFTATILGESESSEPDHQLVWMPVPEALSGLLHESQRWAVREACGRV